MTRAEKVEALLEGFAAEDRIRGRDARFAADFLGLSLPRVYALTSTGNLPCIKFDGTDRGRRGRAGSVRFRLVDLVRYMVDRELGGCVAPMPVSARRAGAEIRALAGGGR